MSLARGDQRPDVSVLVLAYRQTELLDRVLCQLRDHESEASYEVVVVENEVPAAVAEVVDAHPWVRRLSSPVNRGFGGGVNYAARHARGDFYLMLNDDAEVTEGWLDGLMSAARHHRDAAAVASTLVDADGVVLEAGGAVSASGNVWPPDRGRPLREIQGRGARRVGYATGGSLLVRASVFDEVGGFDLDYHPAYFEDADLSCRIWRAGHEVLSTTASVVVHAESASTAAPAKRALQLRNGSIFRGRFLSDYRPFTPVVRVGEELPAAASRRALFIDDRVPAPGVGSGAGRARQNLLAIAACGYEVALHAREPAQSLDRELTQAGVELAPMVETIEPGSVEVVVLSRPHNFELWPLLKERHPHARFVYDAEARFSARLERQLDLGVGDAERAKLDAELAEMVALERSVVAAADAVVTISTDELEWFEAVEGAPAVHWIDPLPDRVDTEPEVARDGARVVFVAGWEAGADSPNGDAVRWIHDEVLPRLTAKGVSVRFEVTGGGVPDELRSLESTSLQFVGRVDDLEELHRTARLAVAPTRYGAGVKLKVLHALTTATPVVATSTGAEGLVPLWRETLRVADEAERFADQIAELLIDDESWSRANEQLRHAASVHRADAVGSWEDVLRPAPPGGDPTADPGGPHVA